MLLIKISFLKKIYKYEKEFEEDPINFIEDKYF